MRTACFRRSRKCRCWPRKDSKDGPAQPPQIDAIFIPAGGDTLPSLAPLFPYYEMDTKNVKLMGLSGWDYSGVGKETALLGGWFAAPDPKGWQGFTRRYVETYGDAPPRWQAWPMMP